MKRRGTVALEQGQVEELKDFFDSMDASSSGSITKDEVHQSLAGFGIRVASEDFDKMFSEVTSGSEFKFNEFMTMMGGKMAASSTEDQLQRAFKAFDSNSSGTIPTAVLSDALLNLGDKLSRKELNELLAIIENDKQECRYNLFVEAMFASKQQ